MLCSFFVSLKANPWNNQSLLSAGNLRLLLSGTPEFPDSLDEETYLPSGDQSCQRFTQQQAATTRLMALQLYREVGYAVS